MPICISSLIRSVFQFYFDVVFQLYVDLGIDVAALRISIVLRFGFQLYFALYFNITSIWSSMALRSVFQCYFDLDFKFTSIWIWISLRFRFQFYVDLYSTCIQILRHCGRISAMLSRYLMKLPVGISADSGPAWATDKAQRVGTRCVLCGSTYCTTFGQGFRVSRLVALTRPENPSGSTLAAEHLLHPTVFEVSVDRRFPLWY